MSTAPDFRQRKKHLADKFVFRQGRSRETSYARDYDRLMDLLRYEKEHGKIIWVMGPAFSFDYDARNAMQSLIENGYAHGLMAGNALATHDLEGASVTYCAGTGYLYTGFQAKRTLQSSGRTEQGSEKRFDPKIYRGKSH